MELYGQYSKSIVQKTILHIVELGMIFLSFWILFRNGDTWIAKQLNIEQLGDDLLRRQIIFIFHIIIFLRLLYMMLVLLKRKMSFEETISVSFAFVLYYLGFSILVIPVEHAFDYLDIIAIILFITGCVLNTGGETLRHIWKKDPANKGKIYTTGFFRYSRHINYFGDLLWVSAYAIITRNPWSAVIPVLLFFFFAFYNAPKLDQYLREKYGKAYDDYARKTKMLIPFIY